MESVIVWDINPVECGFTIRSYLKGMDWFSTDRVRITGIWDVCAVRDESNCTRSSLSS